MIFENCSYSLTSIFLCSLGLSKKKKKKKNQIHSLCFPYFLKQKIVFKNYKQICPIYLLSITIPDENCINYYFTLPILENGSRYFYFLKNIIYGAINK